MSGKKKIILIVIAVVFLFVALGFALYPVWYNWYTDRHNAELELQYQEAVQSKDDEEINAELERAIAYNTYILPGANDTSSFTQEAQLKAAKDYGDILNVNGDSIMCYVEIPKIDVNLPVYHGTDENVLERGLGHLVGSSLPVGGTGTHAVITGHSGMASKKLFTDLEDLEEGDVFYIKVLGKTLAYQVDQISVVLPEDVSNLMIDRNEDYVTLITCTPYAVNTHRLLVRGTRIPYEEAEEIIEQSPIDDSGMSSSERGYLQGILKGVIIGVILLVVMIIVYVVVNKITKRKKNAGKKEK